MISQTFIARPGSRIQGYRNSQPRFVKVLAVGEDAQEVVATLNANHRENVLMSGSIEGATLDAMDAPVNGLRPHAVIVVHAQGDAADFPFHLTRTASMLSLVVLERHGTLRETREDATVRAIRSFCDLFVTTSDPAFVSELVENLAS